jgi:hypothetical protein
MKARQLEALNRQLRVLAAIPVDLARDFGPTTRGPLGWIVHARSGDKGADANCGHSMEARQLEALNRQLRVLAAILS